VARDDRSKSKIKDLEGIIRSLTKQLRNAHRDNARFKKILERIEGVDSSNKSSNRDVEDSDLELALEDGEKYQLPKNMDKCEKCGKRATITSFFDAAGVNKSYMICSDKNCLHRKKL
jgi:hypothetical protein